MIISTHFFTYFSPPPTHNGQFFYVVFVSPQLKGANRAMKVKRPLLEQRNMFGTRIKILADYNLIWQSCTLKGTSL